ncbi:hypothetical protein O0L34_g13353 [Tuta absoluta]|nr:hypothetical protein O0L34_g13353 [Tuta absoluta]
MPRCSLARCFLTMMSMYPAITCTPLRSAPPPRSARASTARCNTHLLGETESSNMALPSSPSMPRCSLARCFLTMMSMYPAITCTPLRSAPPPRSARASTARCNTHLLGETESSNMALPSSPSMPRCSLARCFLTMMSMYPAITCTPLRSAPPPRSARASTARCNTHLLGETESSNMALPSSPSMPRCSLARCFLTMMSMYPAITCTPLRSAPPPRSARASTARCNTHLLGETESSNMALPSSPSMPRCSLARCFLTMMSMYPAITCTPLRSAPALCTRQYCSLQHSLVGRDGVLQHGAALVPLNAEVFLGALLPHDDVDVPRDHLHPAPLRSAPALCTRQYCSLQHSLVGRDGVLQHGAALVPLNAEVFLGALLPHDDVDVPRDHLHPAPLRSAPALCTRQYCSLQHSLVGRDGVLQHGAALVPLNAEVFLGALLPHDDVDVPRDHLHPAPLRSAPALCTRQYCSLQHSLVGRDGVLQHGAALVPLNAEVFLGALLPHDDVDVPRDHLQDLLRFCGLHRVVLVAGKQVTET